MNGSGKTTLLELLLGRLALTRGRAGRGANVVVGEIEQARDGLVGAGALVEQFCEATSLSAVEARTLLAKFGLAADHFNRPAGTLSPGERTCAALAILMANGANPPCWTSRRTTSTSSPSSSWRQHSIGSEERCSSSPTIVPCCGRFGSTEPSRSSRAWWPNNPHADHGSPEGRWRRTGVPREGVAR